MPKGYSVQQKKELVVSVADLSIIIGHLYKMGNDEILQRYVPKFERSSILVDALGAPWVEIMLEEQKRRRFYMPSCGCQPFIRIQKKIASHVMYVNGQEGHCGGMKFL